MAFKQPPPKRLVICCDGTWLNSSSGSVVSLDPRKTMAVELTGKVSLQTPSNVTRIGRCIEPPSRPIQQITYYQAGLGSRNLQDKILGGAVGYGLAEHIREAYQFIAMNYDTLAYDANGGGVTGDEIYLIGFSRGAFTARSIASFINDVGLLTKIGLGHFYPIFADWENQQKKDWKVPFKYDPFVGHDKPEYSLFDVAGKKRYVEKLVKLGMTTPNVKIKAVAVWDTVGSLGLPRLGIFNTLHHESIDYAFVDTEVPPAVTHAIHAISLDEDRKSFMPTIWELPNPVPGQSLNQVWFAGSHSDVGGSYDDTRAADITLAWMISQLATLGLKFNKEVMKKQFYKPIGNEPELPWSCGPLHNEFKGMYVLTDKLIRSPMSYLRHDHYTGAPRVPHEVLVNTQEKVHSSVRIRWGLRGKNYEGKDYVSAALNGWTVEGTATDAAVDEGNIDAKTIRDEQAGIVWKKGEKIMKEELLSDLEWELLKTVRLGVGMKFVTITP
ncbi:uncharacterized protein BDR25DRAFT_246524 [Lindgomyces ingoldianus]|uniref:Uncharacterized protein n=1 Tax=Lindgomyces ingoldianus TaxID=673940 RepID=A0ACB6Q848_9PLEO|nr:uncharacterized protein BDR25DRAFT_246524 [Lindgomyces ingoldianus]KAF2463083.1 hypothetical protein BDR25DRAFT_246524 [Lindgomyces ingoldianus]